MTPLTCICWDRTSYSLSLNSQKNGYLCSTVLIAQTSLWLWTYERRLLPVIWDISCASSVSILCRYSNRNKSKRERVSSALSASKISLCKRSGWWLKENGLSLCISITLARTALFQPHTPLSSTLHYNELQTLSLPLWQMGWTKRIGLVDYKASDGVGSLERNRLSDHICYLLLISYHIIIQKCKLTAAKLSRKLDGPGSWRMRVFGIASWLALVFILIYWACMSEPSSPTLSPLLFNTHTHTHTHTGTQGCTNTDGNIDKRVQWVRWQKEEDTEGTN